MDGPGGRFWSIAIVSRVGTLILALVLMAAGCGASQKPNDRLRIVTSVAPITSLVESVAGTIARVDGIVPEGVDSHTFEPKPSHSRMLAEADIIIVNGLHLEEVILTLARRNLKQAARIVELAGETITREEWIVERGDPNPHLWTNPVYARRFTEVIRDELARSDPAHAEDFQENQQTLAARIDALDRAVRTSTATIAPEKRKLLTYHDSFPYFAREYGWTVIGAIQPSDFTEPTASEITRLIDQIRAESILAIFGSEVFPSKVLAQIAKQSGARYIDDLRDDDLPGDPGDPDHSYLGLMRFNFITMIAASGGDTLALRNLRIDDD